MTRFREPSRSGDPSKESLERFLSEISRLLTYAHTIRIGEVERLEGEYAQLAARSALNQDLFTRERVERTLQLLRESALYGLLRDAFQRFVELVEPIPEVRHVVALNGRSPDIFTFIVKRDEQVCKLVFRAEDQIMDEFPKLEVEFHIKYMEGRPLDHFIHPLPDLIFSRS